MHADDQGGRAEYRTGVLHVQQIRTIAAQVLGQIHTQPLIRILGDPPGLDALRQLCLHALLRDIGDQVVVLVQTGELVQEVADVNFVSREVTADRVRVN